MDMQKAEAGTLSQAEPSSRMVQFHKPYITMDEITEVLDSLKAGWITMGPKTIEFENKFRTYLGSGNAVSMNSCTACLHLALKAIGLGAGDEVIVPTVTFTATGEVVTYFNATPVLVDVEEETCNIDSRLIERKITKKTRAIMPVHFAGQICDMDEICALARKYNLAVIEDAAHAMPAWYKGRAVGTIGDISCFSFYATKPLTTGEGGMATTENDGWADAMRTWRLHGISKDAWKRYTGEGSWYYEVSSAGFKYNMTDIQASLGLAQLRKIDWMWQRRKEIAGAYSGAFGFRDDIEIPFVKADRESSWHLYVVKLNIRCAEYREGPVYRRTEKKRGHGFGAFHPPAQASVLCVHLCSMMRGISRWRIRFTNGSFPFRSIRG